ncbi:hypothetical protein HOY82DRAFT_33872 [Tuber indicum]|nr:hypothetical protein HOY82DRAFT_33872 [Tuber indicum]
MICFLVLHEGWGHRAQVPALWPPRLLLFSCAFRADIISSGGDDPCSRVPEGTDACSLQVGFMDRRSPGIGDSPTMFEAKTVPVPLFTRTCTVPYKYRYEYSTLEFHHLRQPCNLRVPCRKLLRRISVSRTRYETSPLDVLDIINRYSPFPPTYQTKPIVAD